MMLRAMLPIELNFDGSECGLDKGGLYMSDRIRVCASMVGDNFKWLSHVVAHEMGHHLYKNYLSAEDQKFWSFAIGDDWGDLDLREILAMWPTSMHMSAFERDLRAKDPILSLQFEGLSSGIDPSFMVDWTKREDIEEYLAKGGQNPVKVPRNPITAYAMKNREEAFCEAVGLMVSYGPRALPKAVVSWLRQILPSLKVGMAHRVAARFLG
jgi:hypothetical protein